MISWTSADRERWVTVCSSEAVRRCHNCCCVDDRSATVMFSFILQRYLPREPLDCNAISSDDFFDASTANCGENGDNDNSFAPHFSLYCPLIWSLCAHFIEALYQTSTCRNKDYEQSIFLDEYCCFLEPEEPRLWSDCGAVSYLRYGYSWYPMRFKSIYCDWCSKGAILSHSLIQIDVIFNKTQIFWCSDVFFKLFIYSHWWNQRT